MVASDAYDTLLEMFGFPGSDNLRRILEMMMTPEQARMAAALPGNVEEVANKIGSHEEEVRQGLHDLALKGVAFPKGDFNDPVKYNPCRHVMQLHDATQATSKLNPTTNRDFFRAWHDFCLAELYPALVMVYKGLGGPPTRVVPAFKSIQDLPDVLPHEDYHELLRAQELIAVVPCSCRLRTTSVGEQCASHAETEEWVCLQFGKGAAYVIARGSGRQITAKEAIDLCDTIEDHGLIHMWGNHAQTFGINTSCNCCHDCCMNYASATLTGTSIGIQWEKSRYEAYVDDPDLCTGCEDCVERCPFDAIEMAANGNGEGAEVSSEKCWGCGVCVVGCPSEALKMKAVRPPEFIPDAPAQAAGH
jgi:NAD-dependent dihydropyrimidine dehydrogenase PreA subunit